MRAAAASVSSMACFRTRAERVVLVAASFSADMPLWFGVEERSTRSSGGGGAGARAPLGRGEGVTRAPVRSADAPALRGSSRRSESARVCAPARAESRSRAPPPIASRARNGSATKRRVVVIGHRGERTRRGMLSSRVRVAIPALGPARRNSHCVPVCAHHLRIIS